MQSSLKLHNVDIEPLNYRRPRSNSLLRQIIKSQGMCYVYLIKVKIPKNTLSHCIQTAKDKYTAVRLVRSCVCCIGQNSTSLDPQLVSSSAAAVDDVMNRRVAAVVHPTHMSISGDVTTAFRQRRIDMESRRKCWNGVLQHSLL